MTATGWWLLGLSLFAVVTVVVAVLLGLIIATARRIEQNAARVWTVGKQIAGNTVSIWMLEQANGSLSRMQRELQLLERKVLAVDERLRELHEVRS